MFPVSWGNLSPVCIIDVRAGLGPKKGRKHCTHFESDAKLHLCPNKLPVPLWFSWWFHWWLILYLHQKWYSLYRRWLLYNLTCLNPEQLRSNPFIFILTKNDIHYIVDDQWLNLNFYIYLDLKWYSLYRRWSMAFNLYNLCLTNLAS